MQRLDIDQENIESLAEREFEAASTQDVDLPPEERRDRLAVDDTTTSVAPPGLLKRFDDVRLWDWIEGRVVGPARGVGQFAVHSPANVGDMGELIIVGLDAVTDRAPLDPGETPMPVIPPEPENPPDLVDLANLRMQAFMKIDQRSDALIAAGFEFNGLVYSCSLEAQIRMNAMLMLSDSFTYPMEINALDDQHKGLLNTPQETQMWCLTALGHIKAVVDSGTVEKDRIRNATDIAFIANYEDPRQVPERNPLDYTPPSQDSSAEAPVQGTLPEES